MKKKLLVLIVALTLGAALTVSAAEEENPRPTSEPPVVNGNK